MECIVKISEAGDVDNVKTVARFFKDLPAGSTGTLTWKPAELRSLQANAYIHAVLFPEALIALREGGFSEVQTVKDAKDVCKGLFLKKEYMNHAGVTLTTILDTSELTKQQMSEFIENVIRWLAEYFNHIVPPPSTQTSINYGV